MVKRWFRKDATEGSSSSSITDEPPAKRWFQSRRNVTANPTSTKVRFEGVRDDDPDSERSYALNDHTTSAGASLIQAPVTTSFFGRFSFREPAPALTTDLEEEVDIVPGSIMDALYSLMGDEDLSDVRMQGSDGGNVVAVKAILAARSPVFRSRFFGAGMGPGQSSKTLIHSNLSSKDDEDDLDDLVDTTDADLSAMERDAEAGRVEAIIVKNTASTSTDETANITLEDDAVDDDGKTNIVFEEWDCRVLYLIVEYCYTDNLAIFTVRPSDDIARMMASLRCASKAFKLRGLLEKVDKWSDINTTRHPALACALIDEGMRLDDIDALAMRTVQLKTKAALMPGVDEAGSGICAFSKPGLMFILRFLDDKTSHMLLYDAMMTWVNFSTEGTGLYSDPVRERSGKLMFASRVAKRFIRVEKIDPSRMEEVLKSGLVEVEKGPTVS